MGFSPVGTAAGCTAAKQGTQAMPTIESHNNIDIP